MSAEKGYNGWTNYETWNVALWMDNEESSYHDARQGAIDVLEEVDGDADDAKDALAVLLKNEYEDAAQTVLETAKVSASVWSDLLGAALSEVNWHEIASHLVDEVKEEYEVEEVE